MSDNISNTKVRNVIIIGSGAAGNSAAIYAARANLEPLMIHGLQPGGQLTITTEVENYPGFAEAIQGPWLMEQMIKQAENVGTEIVNAYVTEIDFDNYPYTIKTDMGETYQTKSVIICTGASAKWLGLKSEQKFMGFGVSGCATCDGFFYRGKEVAVIGGGNTAVEEALYLTKHASKVYLIHRRDSLRAEKVMQERLFNHDKIEVIWNHELDEVLGDEEPLSVTGARLKSTQNGSSKELKVDGIFVAIGHKPNTDIFVGKIDMDKEGYIITKAGSPATNIKGVFAAGDVQDKIYRQAITAAGTGCMAALDAIRFIEEQE